MAQCILPDTLIEADRLPMLCMVCGKEATVQFVREFNTFPRWIYLLLPGYFPFMLFYLAFRQTKYLHVRFCDSHRLHFYLRSITVPLGVASIFVASIGNALYVTTEAWQTVGWAAIFIGAILWIGVLIYQRLTSIHPIKINPYDITLVNIHEDYAAEVRHTVGNDLERQLRQ